MEVENSITKLFFDIIQSKMTPEEVSTFEFETFVKDTKPVGNMRIVVNENEGYIEKFNGKDWRLYRKLNQTEITEMMLLD